jgi:hypothetical protein
MNYMLTDEALTVVGGLAFVFIFLSLWVGQTAIPRDDLPGFKQAGLALQLSGTKEKIEKIIGPQDSHDRAQLRAGINRDFALILSYASFFVALGLLLSQANTSGAKWLGFASVIVVLGAAAFDMVENYRSLQILSLPNSSITDPLCSALRHVSILKWLFLFLAIVFQAVVLIKLMNWYSLIGLGLIINALAGIAAIRFTQLFPYAVPGFGFFVLVLGIVLVAAPQHFLAHVTVP